MKKLIAVLVAALGLMALGAVSAQAANNGTYDPNTGIVTVTVGNSYEGTSTVPVANGDIVSFQYQLSPGATCGGGAPRVFVQGGAYNTFDLNPNQCGTLGPDGWYTVTGTVSGVTNGTVGQFGLVYDFGLADSVASFRNVTVNGVSLLPPLAPQNKDECKNGGWRNGSYENQGECVSHFARTK